MKQEQTNNFFDQHKISFVMDGGAGSSGKSLISSYMVKHADNVDFLMSAFTPNASHTVVDDDDVEFVFKIFPGGSQYHEKLKAIYIVDNAAIELDTLWKEMEFLGIPREKVRISPRCGVVQQIDKDFETGLCDLDGNYFEKGKEGDGTVKTGTTASGSGAVLAKKVVRNKTLVTAKDIAELSDMIYDMGEIVGRLERGESALFEIAQGFPLSLNHHLFAPHTTSRNVTVTNALNDANIPPKYAGNVILNWRTFPIKIHSWKYKCKETGKFLHWDEVQNKSKDEYDKIESYSGDFYPDQTEISWEDITKNSGSETPIMECTTLTKLPRRIATFSPKNLEEAIMFNRTNGNTFLVINFVNYITSSVYGKREFGDLTIEEVRKIDDWVDENIKPSIVGTNVKILFFGTGRKIEDRIKSWYL